MPVEPRPAATLLLLRDGAAGLEVLMMERHRDAFFSSALVFPGGRVDAEDYALAHAHAVPGLGEDEASFRIAAVRESWEEARILLVKKRGEDRIAPASEIAPFGPKASFASVLAGGFVPATDRLVPFAHWVTPEDSPKRFDTKFFLALAPADQQPSPDGDEAVELVWMTPARAFAEADAKKRRLIFATRLNLHRLMRSRTAADALRDAARHPLTRICPEVYTAPDGPHLRIPEGLGYDICDMLAAERRHY